MARETVRDVVEPSASESPLGIAAPRLLVATPRPAVAAFLASLDRRRSKAFRVRRIQLATDALAEHPGRPPPAAAVVDVGPDPAAATDFCGELSERWPGLPVAALVCCPHSVTPWHLRSLLAAGVSGVLDLHGPPEEMVRALDTVMRGGSVVNLNVRRGQRGALHEMLAGGRHPRGEMQLRLLELVALGLPDREIGRRIHLSPHTVKHHIEQLRAEVGARNRTELAAWAGRAGFYPLPRRASATPSR